MLAILANVFFFFTFFLLFNKKYWKIWQNGKNDNFATIANRAKQKAMREPIKVGDTGKYGNFVTIANRAKHKVMREPIKVGGAGKFVKYGKKMPQLPTGQGNLQTSTKNKGQERIWQNWGIWQREVAPNNKVVI